MYLDTDLSSVKQRNKKPSPLCRKAFYRLKSGLVEQRGNQSFKLRLMITGTWLSRRHSCGVGFLFTISRFTHWLRSYRTSPLPPCIQQLSLIPLHTFSVVKFLSSSPERTPRESPLHLAVRWGLFRLAELLLCQPGGLMAVSLPNQEGVTPLQLAQTAANTEILELLAQ